MAVVAGCTFPEIGFEPLGGSPGGSGGAGAGQSSTGGAGGTFSSAGGASGGEGGVGGAGGAGGTGGSTGSIPSTGTGADCDADGDGHLAMGMCDGDDCDDNNKLVYPGQPLYYTTPNDNGFDYDCNGLIERDPVSDTSVDCSGLNGCNLVKQGYTGSVPSCGQTGAWGRCTKSGFNLFCKVETLDPARPMACK